MRLSGIAASIGTFAFLMIIYSVYLRWSTWTSGASSVIGLPQRTTPWVAYCYAVVTILGAFFYSRSKFGPRCAHRGTTRWRPRRPEGTSSASACSPS